MSRTKSDSPIEKTAKKNSRFSYQKEFYSDYDFPGMLYGAIIRGPFAGKFESISKDGLPDGYTVITAENIPGKKYIENSAEERPIPIFCENETAYKGEPLGMVIGPDEEKVIELSKNIGIQYKEMYIPGKKSLYSSSHKISTSNMEEIKEITKELQVSGLDDFNFTEIGMDNLEVVASRTIQSGPCFGRVRRGYPKGIDKAIESCAHVIENKWTYKIDPTDYHEPSGAICRYINEDDETEIEIYAHSLWLSNMRQVVSDVLKIKPESIKINKTRSTNSSSNSVWYNSIIAAQTALASYCTKKVVKLVYSTNEQKKFMDKMQPIIITNRTGTDENGKIQAMDIHIDVEAGFYNPFAQEIVDRLTIASYGCYQVPNLKITSRALATLESASSLNLQMLDSAAFFAIENQMNEISKRLNMSPAEIRKINFMPQENLSVHPPFSFIQENKNDLIDQICEMTEFEKLYFTYKMNHELDLERTKKSNRYSEQKDEQPSSKANDLGIQNFHQRGIGLSCGFEGTCYFGSQMYKDSDPSLEIIWKDSNTLTVHTPIYSKSAIEILKAKISSLLGIAGSGVKIDSDFTISEEPLIPDVLNSNISVTMELTDKCCDALLKARAQKKKFPLIIQRKITERQKKKWNQDKFEGTPFLRESFGIAIVNLQLDKETYKVSIRELTILIDGGKIYNKEIAENRIKLAIHKILAGIIEGETVKVESIKIEFIDSDKNAAQIGELPYQILPSAITQAISQIIGEPISELPIKADTIYKILQEQSKKSNVADLQGKEDSSGTNKEDTIEQHI